MNVKIVIDGEEVELQDKGKSNSGGYHKYSEPEPYASMGLGRSPLIVTAYVKPGWRPSKKVQE
jgi:hypothetical protein